MSTGSDDASQTLAPDLDDTDASLTGIAGFVLHDTVAPTAFSPGTKIDGSPF